MGLKEVEEKIREEGGKEEEEIQKETERVVQEIKGKIDEEAEKEYEEEKRKKKKELSVIPKKIVSDANMEKKKELNSKKSELLDEVFTAAQEKILQMSDKKKKKILKNLIQQEERENPIIYVDKKYASLLKDMKGVKAKKGMEDFGVIIESKEGSLRIDNTLSNAMERIRTKIEPEVAKILFQ